MISAQAWMISLIDLTAWAISVDNWLSALPSVLHHICNTRNPFDLRCENITYHDTITIYSIVLCCVTI